MAHNPPALDGPSRANLILPLVILIVGAGLSVVGAQLVRREMLRGEELRFDRLCDRVETEVKDRLFNVEVMLRGAAGLHRAGENITPAAWRQFCTAVRIPKLPGVVALAMVRRVPHLEQEAFVREMRAAGITDFAIRSTADQGDLAVLAYLHPPESRNLAVGFDLASDENRREALERSARTGQPGLTRRLALQLAGLEKVPGLVLLQPLYQHGASLEYEADRARFYNAMLRVQLALETLAFQLNKVRLDSTFFTLALQEQLRFQTQKTF